MRSRFDEQLDLLNLELIKLGALCEEAISAAAKALLDNDAVMRDRAIAAEREIDQKENEIEAICLRLLLQQHPVAKDLRLISSALKMISDMERIGDQAQDIAEITRFINEKYISNHKNIADMARATIKMVTDSVESFVQKDLALARSVEAYDDVVDDLFKKVRTDLTRLIRQNPDQGDYCLDLLMIAKYFERIGDHAVNIAGWVVFSLTGRHTGELT
ncbi:MAG TPA: phosphate signaling complex protein PhoU [Clostridiales bacterium]|nr:phosphate signaling complex protein PhoU [Clostridiales bacterium]